MISIILLLLFLHPFISYPLTLMLLTFFNKKPTKHYDNRSVLDVTLIIVAHNEEKVIEKKILNCLELDYPKDKLKIVVASDFSTDNTNNIVLRYSEKGVELIKTTTRLGRANAHNEALKVVDSSIIAYSDANTMWKKSALLNLVQNFKDPKVGYVTGKLIYTNTGVADSAASEGLYWRIELFLRQLESDLGSITAGNGAIYAIRKECAHEIDVLYSHDISFPCGTVKRGFKSKYDANAIAEEKAGETSNEEFKRKVRMFGRAFYFMRKNLWILNPNNVGFLYLYFFISHRVLRYFGGLLLLAFIISFLLLYVSIFSYLTWLSLVSLLIFLSLLTKTHYKIYYFLLFQVATLVGLWKYTTGKIKPFWTSPKSTREI